MDKISVTKYSKIENPGYLLGIFSIIVPKWGNFYINNLKHFSKNNHDWIGFPSKEYGEDDEKKYFPFCGFTERSIKDKFEKIVIEALHEYFTKNPTP